MGQAVADVLSTVIAIALLLVFNPTAHSQENTTAE